MRSKSGRPIPATFSVAGSRPTSRPRRLSATLFGLLGILTASAGVTSCSSVSSAPKASLPPSLSLYQPPVLRLPAGAPIQTLDGVYTPQAPEIWHSDARFRQAEQQASDAAAALAQLKNVQ